MASQQHPARIVLMETVQGNLYDYPRYYDLVYGSDWRAEFDLLQHCFEEHTDVDVRRVFEPACGTGRLLYRLAKAGYEVSGLDLNERAVDYCNERLQRHGFAPSVWIGDMSDFSLPQPIDVAFNTINSFRHLHSEEEAQSHIKCVAESLCLGGLYVLGLHLTPTVGEPIDQESWSAQQGFLCVNTSMWTIDRDLSKRCERVRMTMDVYKPTNSFRLTDEIDFRTYTLDEFQQLLDAVAVFDVAALYDFTYQIEQEVELSPETEDVVFVLRKR